MAKIICQELQSLLEEKKDEIDLEEQTYVELANKIVDVYNAIEETEYCCLYYTKTTEEFDGDIYEPSIEPCTTTLQLTNDAEYQGCDLTNLREVLFYNRKINRQKFQYLKQRVNSPIHSYHHTINYGALIGQANCGYTIFKVIEL